MQVIRVWIMLTLELCDWLSLPATGPRVLVAIVTRAGCPKYILLGTYALTSVCHCFCLRGKLVETV